MRNVIFRSFIVLFLTLPLNANETNKHETLEELITTEAQKCFDAQIVSDKLYEKLSDQYFKSPEKIQEYYLFRDSIENIINKCITLPIFVKDVRAAKDLVELLNQVLNQLEVGVN